VQSTSYSNSTVRTVKLILFSCARKLRVSSRQLDHARVLLLHLSLHLFPQNLKYSKQKYSHHNV